MSVDLGQLVLELKLDRISFDRDIQKAYRDAKLLGVDFKKTSSLIDSQ